jgi:hypothetical protein
LSVNLLLLQRGKKKKTKGELYHGHKGDVAAVHGLKGNATAVAVKVGFSDKVLDGLEDLLEEASLNETSFKHGWFFLTKEE